MTNWTELKRLAESIKEGCGLKGADAEEAMFNFECAATPETILALIAENERFESALSAPETITAEPADDYEALRKQFMSLRMLANSNAKMVQHWRDQCGRETRETLLANADNVNAERATNAMLTDALEAAEDERDQLRAEVEALRKDAERYRWLRAHHGLSLKGHDFISYGEVADFRIDNAMTVVKADG